MVPVAGALVGALVQRRNIGGTFGKRMSNIVISKYCLGLLQQQVPRTWLIAPAVKTSSKDHPSMTMFFRTIKIHHHDHPSICKMSISITQSETAVSSRA
jgi:hypothetical protein